MIGYLDEDGTATVTGRRLPADQAAAACARIEDLAKAAKRAGHPERIGPLRASIYLGLLDGRWARLTRDQIIADLLDQVTADDTAQDPTPGGASDDTPAAEAPAGPDDGHSAGSAEQPATGQRVGVELRVGLSTLLGRDRRPGEIPGWGPVTAETARTIAAARHDAEWRYAITCPDGRLLLAGITRRRPAIPEGTGSRGTGTGLPAAAVAPGRRGIVELHIPATLLTELAAPAKECGTWQWATVITDLAAQYRAHHAHRARDGAGRAGEQDPAARFAGTVLRRHVQIRDRVCVYPGCRCPARHADVDHTVDHARGGATIEANLGLSLCTHGDDGCGAAGRDLLPDLDGSGGCWVGCGPSGGRLPGVGGASGLVDGRGLCRQRRECV